MLAQSGDFLGDLARLVFLLSIVLAPILKSRAESKAKSKAKTEGDPVAGKVKRSPRRSKPDQPDQDFLDLDPWERMLRGQTPQDALPSVPEQESPAASPPIPQPAPTSSVERRAPQRQRMNKQPLSAPLSQTSEVNAPFALSPRPESPKVARPHTIGAPLGQARDEEDDHLGAHLPSEFRTRALPSQSREERGRRDQSLASELSESPTPSPTEHTPRRTDWRRAIVLSELIAPPVALRGRNAGIGAPPGLR